MSKVTVTKVDGKYQASVTRTVNIGDRCHITPSMGYAGIEYGLVKVEDIITGEEYLAAPHRFKGITQFISIAVTGVDYDHIDLTNASDSEREEYKELISKPWVAYSYANTEANKELLGLKFYFPMEEFIEHTSSID